MLVFEKNFFIIGKFVFKNDFFMVGTNKKNPFLKTCGKQECRKNHVLENGKKLNKKNRKARS